MAHDISFFGTQVSLTASFTFPNGISISQFADDGDPLNITEMKIGDAAMSVNGTLVAWRKPAVIMIDMNIIPNSEDDKNLQILFDNNRLSKNHSSSNDVLTITCAFPDGTTATYTGGIMLQGLAGNSGASSGRFKSKKYQFAFEDKI